MIKFRKFFDGDTEALVRILNEQEVFQYLSSKIPSPYTVEDAEWWIRTGSNQGIIYAIEVDEKLVGCIGVNPGEFEYARSGEIGYWLDRSYWGKGLMTKAINEIVSDVFSNTEIVRIFAAVFSTNAASMVVLSKCGFKLEAIHTSAIFKDNQFYDNHIFAILKTNDSRT